MAPEPASVVAARQLVADARGRAHRGVGPRLRGPAPWRRPRSVTGAVLVGDERAAGGGGPVTGDQAGQSQSSSERTVSCG